MSLSKLFVNRFVVSKSDNYLYDQSFHHGVNIIRGANGTGKSTIVDLLSYALGSIITDWTKHQLLCDWVMVEVELSGTTYCLKRKVKESGQAKMAIFEGLFEKAATSVTNWTEYSMRRSSERHSFSQQIFELLGLPTHKTDDSKNLTLHQIFRLIYVDQLSAINKLLKEEKDFDNATYRRAIGDYLLGIDDLEAHNQRQALIIANKEFERLNGELNAIYKLFGNEASQINEQVLNNDINEIENRLEELKQNKNDALHTHTSDLDDVVIKKASALQIEIEKLFLEKQELESDKSELSLELIDTKLFIYSLNDRKEALEQSRLTFSSLGNIKFKYCPACLEPIVEHNQTSCGLCKTEIDQDARDFSYIQMLNELNFQIRESEALIIEFKNGIDSIDTNLSRLIRRLEESKFSYRELEVTAEAKEAIVSEISSEMGFCKSQILSLEDRREHVRKVESLRKDKILASERIQVIKDKLDQINKSQADRFNRVYESIESKASDLLALDGGYESAFDEVEAVNFNFSKDKMFVNGRSKFSASSMVVMKNSIRLSIFLHAVDDEKSRLPNFMIMDNIEDKGMIVERSHNFQHNIISECMELEDEYQLIFTTSMIAPDLNDSSFCVGPMYEKGMHTLEFKSN